MGDAIKIAIIVAGITSLVSAITVNVIDVLFACLK